MPCIRYIPAILALGGVLLITGCPGTTRKKSSTLAQPVTTATAPVKSTKFSWQRYHFTFPDPTAPVWVADVNSGETDQKTGVSILHGVKCRMYRQGQEQMSATADDGKALLQGKVAHVTLFGHVVATDPKHKLRMQSDSLHWVSNEDVATVTKVHACGPTFEQWADRGSVSLDLTKATLSGHLHVETTDMNSIP